MMDMWNDLEQMCETLEKELKSFNKKLETNKSDQLTLDDLARIERVTHSLKSIKGVMAMMSDGDMYSNARGMGSRGYSGRNYPANYYNDGSYRGGGSYGMPYLGNMVYAQGRNDMGQFTNNGYSRHGDILTKLREVRYEVPDHIRPELDRLIEHIEQTM